MDDKWWETVSFCIEILKPIAEELIEDQGDYHNVAALYYAFTGLIKLYSNKSNELKNKNDNISKICFDIGFALKTAWEKFMKSKLFRAGACIDARFTEKFNKEMNNEDKKIGFEALRHYSIVLFAKMGIDWHDYIKKKEQNENSNDNNNNNNASSNLSGLTSFASFTFNDELFIDKTKKKNKKKGKQKKKTIYKSEKNHHINLNPNPKAIRIEIVIVIVVVIVTMTVNLKVMRVMNHKILILMSTPTVIITRNH